nr:hypothetical protein [Jiella pacifica]
MVGKVHPGMEDADDEETPAVIEAIDHIVRPDEFAQIAGPNSVDRLTFGDAGRKILASSADPVGIAACLSWAEQLKTVPKDVPDIGFGLS